MHRPVQLIDEDPSCPAPCIFPLGQRRGSGLPRTPHPSAVLATNLRVAPNLRSIRLCRERTSELPRISRFSAVPLMKLRVAPVLRSAVSPTMSLRVAPNPASSGFAGDGVPSCLESRILRRIGEEAPSCLGSPLLGIASDEVPGCPGPCIFRPRLVVFQVTLDLAPTGFAIGESPGCPESSSSGPPTDQISRLPQIFDPSAVPTFGSPGCPESSTFRRRRFCFPGLPRFGIYGWVDDESPSVLELCIFWQASG